MAPAKKWTPGRPKGAINVKTREFQAILEERGFNVAEALLDLFDAAAGEYKKMDGFDPVARVAAIKLMADITRDIASYSLPKLKAIEVQKESPLEGMTPKEKLSIMKEAVKLLESETKAKEPVSENDQP